MFDNFYPTPPVLIDKMLSGLNTSLTQTILEPSAGKGDLAEAIKAKINGDYGRREADIDCIEIQPELQSILKGKKFRVVYDDFLTFDTLKQYDLILMNPPFDNGDKHLSKALELQQNGGSILCLLSAETIRNPYTNARKTLVRQLNDYEAQIEYIKGAFLEAERPTPVEVALIKVTIPKKNFESKILDNLRKAPRTIDAEQQSKHVSRFGVNSFLDFIVEQYNFEAKAGINLIHEFVAMQPLLMDKIKKSDENKHFYSNSIIELKIKDGQLNTNSFIRKLRYKYWEALFNHPKFVGKLTQNLVTALHNKLSTLQDYDFTIYNIITIQEELMGETIRGVEETIIKLFDDFSHKYHWADETSKNIHYFNGWKTNKSWKINKKVIIPLNGFDSYDKRPYFKYSVLTRLSDITKVFDYLDSGRTQNVNTDMLLQSAQDRGQTSKIQLKYFTVTFYKKGTCHIEFTDLALLEKFNLYGCQRKGWLPPHYGKRRYEDMCAEEQEIVKEFSGSEAEYSKIFEDPEFYLIENNSQLLLAEKFE